MNLNQKEQETLRNTVIPQGRIKMMSIMNTFRKVYNSLCSKCKQKVLQTTFRNQETRSEAMNDLNFYCPDCQIKVKEILKSYDEKHSGDEEDE